jgi:hypothetical protein
MWSICRVSCELFAFLNRPTSDQLTSLVPTPAKIIALRAGVLAYQGDMTESSSVDFFRRLRETCPIKITKISRTMARNSPPGLPTRRTSPVPAISSAGTRKQAEIEHHSAPPCHRETKGMVTRFNGRISVLATVKITCLYLLVAIK